MPDFRVSPLSIVNQIRSNLEDRYDSGYPVLKELLQNADDAGARRFRTESFSGWPQASNPLLRGPGLLVINDGAFKESDEQGITSFGESEKATDNAAIGKFGFGQKAVFHLCDAFIVYSHGGAKLFSTVVNPFLGVNVQGNITQEWEPAGEFGLIEDDLQRLRGRTLDFQDRCLILWLPFRRRDLRPAPGLWFSSAMPSSSQTIAELARPEDLAAILTSLLHLESIEVRDNGLTVCAVELKATDGRLVGPSRWPTGERNFRGAINVSSAAGVGHFVGREATAANGCLQQLQSGAHWPRTISVLDPAPQPQKGKPHAAAILLRWPKDRPPQLRISWAVFLPVSEDSDIVIPLEGKTLAQFQLQLHGYFFLDSGRRRIEGLDSPASDDDPADGAALRRTWNATLRDTVLLPLVPRLLRDALDAKIVTSAELSDLVSNVASDPWFRSNRSAICRKDALVRVLEKSGAVIWRLATSEMALHPLPASVEDMRGKIEELFPDIQLWANSKDARLIVDKQLALTAEPVGWTSADLERLFTGLTPRAFQSRDLSRLLGEFLETAEVSGSARAAIAPYILSALRKAMIDTPSLAPVESIRGILNSVPAEKVFALPPSVDHREPLRAFASASSEVLPIRHEWCGATISSPRISIGDLKALLEAIQPLLGGGQADQAATAALALLMRAERSLPDLARDAEIADLKILRARDARAGCHVALSLRELVELSTEGSLFAPSPEATRLLAPLAAALPDMPVLVVEGDAARFLRETDNSPVRLQPANKEAALRLANKSRSYGSVEARLNLLERIRPEVGDDPVALRRLCAGEWYAGLPDAKLWIVESAHKDLERIVNAIIDQSRNGFLVPAKVAEEIKERLRNQLHIARFGTPDLQRLLSADPLAISRIEATATERDALLETDLTDSLLARLPIFQRTDGTVGDASGVFLATTEWSIPLSMEVYVDVVQPAASRRAHARQTSIVKAWTPESQIETALGLPEPHRYCGEVLQGLAAVPEGSVGHLLSMLRVTPWLITEATPIAPAYVLALPPNVDEAARLTLFREGEIPVFSTAQKLAIDIRNSDGFENLRRWILPNVDQSFDALTMMIGEHRIVGRLGTTAGYPLDDFAVLARSGTDLRLPGWPLLAAVLNALQEERATRSNVVGAFAGPDPSEFQIAADHLHSLSILAADNGRVGEAAGRAYLHGFASVTNWSEEIRRLVFGATPVPTESGVWRIGREVVQDGEGLEPSYVLARNCAFLLRASRGRIESEPGLAPNPVSRDAPSRKQLNFEAVDLAHIESKVAEQHRSFLRPWRAHLPPDLVIVYLGLIGRQDPFKQLANEWRADATTDPETLWEELDGRFPKHILYPNPLAVEVRQRLIFIETVTGGTVRAVSMSGEVFDAPLDLAAKGLVVGNLHKKPRMVRAADGKQRDLMTVSVRRVQPSDLEQNRVSSVFREFVETVAVDCLYLVSTAQQDALRNILDKAIHIDQSTLEETELLLRDRLPMILAELKLPNASHSQDALRNYQDAEGHHHRLARRPEEMEELKTNLWREVLKPDVAAELLTAVRAKIEDFGYSAGRILFELFQNADDAYRQFEVETEQACFRVELLSEGLGGFRVVHWGRPINHLDVREGRRLGHDRDLLNMLLMNFSEKRVGDDLTGKFGLGFKSVHVVSDSVGIASGYIALRITGGLLPVSWAAGKDVADAHKRPNGPKATVIDVPFAAEAQSEGDEAKKAFLGSAAWLPAFARKISRIEILGDVLETIKCVRSPILDDRTIDVVVSISSEKQRALRFDLGDGFCVLVKVGTTGPEPFSRNLKRLWNLAPLEEALASGWLLNGPFAVDPGRGRLAGSLSNHYELFQRLGVGLGKRLIALHDLASLDWRRLAVALDLDVSDANAKSAFWTKLFGVLSADFDHELAGHLHGVDRGYGRLAAERHATPTSLPQPLQALVRAGEVRYYAEGAISDRGLLERLQDWAAVVGLRGQIVAFDIAKQLSKIGFRNIQPIRMSDLLRREIGGEALVDVELATRLGRVLTLQAVELSPLFQEKTAILDVVKGTNFLAQDGTFRPVRSLSFELGSDDEKLIYRFAPDATRLHQSYRGDALEFFTTARSRSGYGPNANFLTQWARAADNVDRQLAVLEYLVKGQQAHDLAQHLQKDLPTWFPTPLESLMSHPLLSGWSEDARMELLLAMGGHRFFTISAGEPKGADPIVPGTPRIVLDRIHAWWEQEHAAERKIYARSTYPESVSPSELCEGDNRVLWFTMFALGCFHSFGRAQEEQHRGFIEGGWRQGWWQELAASKPPNDVQSWMDRLEHWSQPFAVDQPFLPWRRTFVDLYTIARWLEDYVEVMRKLPRIIEKFGVVSLNGALQPSYWAPATRLCLEAAPINRSLGLGINWMIREMLRFGVYSASDERVLAPYCWMSSERLRRLFGGIGANVEPRADKESSRAIYDFVVSQIGKGNARFHGDFDLPLQTITRATNRGALLKCFDSCDRDPPDFETDETDLLDAIPFEITEP